MDNMTILLFRASFDNVSTRVWAVKESKPDVGSSRKSIPVTNGKNTIIYKCYSQLRLPSDEGINGNMMKA